MMSSDCVRLAGKLVDEGLFGTVGVLAAITAIVYDLVEDTPNVANGGGAQNQ